MTEFDSTPQPGDSIDALLAQLGHKEALVRSESEAYLAWLEQFTASHGHIYSDMFQYPTNNGASPADVKFTGYTEAFVIDIVLNYAEENYIAEHLTKWHGLEAAFSYNGNTYIAGIMHGQGSVSYVKQAEEDRVKDPVRAPDIETILAGGKTERALAVDQKLAKLGELASGLVAENGVSWPTIRQHLAGLEERTRYAAAAVLSAPEQL